MAEKKDNNFKASIQLYNVPGAKDVWVEVQAPTLKDLEARIQEVIDWAKEKYPISGGHGATPVASKVSDREQVTNNEPVDDDDSSDELPSDIFNNIKDLGL